MSCWQVATISTSPPAVLFIVSKTAVLILSMEQMTREQLERGRSITELLLQPDILWEVIWPLLLVDYLALRVLVLMVPVLAKVALKIITLIICFKCWQDRLPALVQQIPTSMASLDLKHLRRQMVLFCFNREGLPRYSSKMLWVIPLVMVKNK